MARSRLRRVLSAGAVFAAGAAMATASTLPSQAEPRQQPANAAVRALADHLGVSMKQARQRITDDARAGKQAADLERQLGAASAGSYVDHGDPAVNVTTQQAAHLVRSAGVHAEVVQTPKHELTAIKSDLDQIAANSGAGRVRSWSVDIRRNQVRVVTSPGARDQATRAFLAEARQYAPVKVVRTDAVIEPMADLVGGQQIEFSGYICSAGFNAADASGNPVLLTAGHCGENYATFSSGGVEIGTTTDYTFPGSGDYAQVPISNTYWTARGAVASDTGEQRVAGSQKAGVGAAICKSGRTTGWTCGTVVSQDTTVNYDNGDGSTSVVSGLTRTDTCTEGGDSGGPNMSGAQAQGMTSGGAGYDDDGNPLTAPVCGEKVGEENISFIQPINEPLDAYGLTLITEGGGDAGDDRPGKGHGWGRGGPGSYDR